MESISVSAFENCKSLKNVTFRGDTKNIGSNAFRATSLTSLTLPDGLETIGADAFYGIATLSGMLVIPESVTKIEKQAFWTGRNNGNGLLSDISGIRVDSPKISIGNGAFKATGANSLAGTKTRTSTRLWIKERPFPGRPIMQNGRILLTRSPARTRASR